MAVEIHDNSGAQANELLLWAGVLLGPTAAMLNEGLSYSMTQHACSTGHVYVLHVSSACCFLLASASVWIARQQLSVVGDGSEHGAGPHNRQWWMARAGVALGIGFALVIIAMAVPKILLSPCD
jgi:4-amino-4-deoxy-L-arabinose transferase-like glycosyltransferase